MSKFLPGQILLFLCERFVSSVEKSAQNEPVEDAFKDMSVYGIIAQIVSNGKWGK